MTTRTRSLAIGLALLCISAVSGRSDDATVRVGRYFSIFDFLNVHSSPRHWISINGRKFGPVKGQAPFYLKVESLDAVFFVTTGKDTDEFAHLVFLKDGKDSSILITHRFDSYGLGASQSANRALRIDHASWPLVFVGSKRGDEVKMHKFDFEKGTCSSEPTIK
jgi:hypothetical protein